MKVFVRIRPKNNAEKNCKGIVKLDEPFTKEIFIQENSYEQYSKKFTFDRVFGPFAKQTDVYNNVVSPLLEEVLAGYNCTVFAYGQTGTGKTFTMEGIGTDSTLNWQSDTTAGIIPRSLSHLFHELQLLDTHGYTVRISLLELYNDELFDLLSHNDNASKIRLYDDSSKKGAVIVHGLEEVTVWSKNDVYKILERGLEKKRTAATLMNAQSSRSHTIFSITVHIKETAVEGYELLKIGKLNLVDLAGSGNIRRSGSADQRAREAGSIKQSLLTLGRVITALGERARHVPYRESKLTRLLQESLGGCTKTSMIATISPANINLEETLSTLHYAHHARSITIRPQLNKKVSKKLLRKEYTEKIEKLRREFELSRERSVIYLAHDNCNGMQEMLCQQRRDLGETLKHIQVLEDSFQNHERTFNELSLQDGTQTNKLHKTKGELSNVTHELQSTKHQLKLTELNREVQEHLMEKHVSTEKLLLSQAHDLLSIAVTATAGTDKLHDKIPRKTQVEKENEFVGGKLRQSVRERLQGIEKDLSTYKEKLQEFCMSTKNDVIVMDASSNHIRFMEEQEVNTSCIAEEINNRLEYQVKEIANFHNKITEKLQILEDHINNFLVEDMKRDLPPGVTPIRKQFSCPRQFNITSPHMRIL